MSAIDTQLDTIARIVQSWLEWQEKDRIAAGMTNHPHTALMALPIPLWPDRAQLQAWIDALNAAQARIAELGLEAATINDMVCGDDGPRGHEETTRALRQILNRIAELEKRLSSSERARQTLSDACDSLHAEIRALKATPTPLPRPDKPGWWWAWNYGDEKWERVEVEFPEAWGQHGMKWLPATPPPAPKNETE